MDGNIHSAKSAKVLSFPVGGRAGAVRGSLRPSMENDNRKAPRIAYDGWYHDAAIEDDLDRGA